MTREAGITFRHRSGGSGRLYLPETMGSGCAFLDYDGDGHLDLLLLNGAPLPGYTDPRPLHPALYRGRGNGTFEEVTRAAGLASERYSLGVAVGDYDNDGWEDLYLAGLGANALYHNRGDGTFREVGREAGVADAGFSTTAAWLDYDRDGRLDLLVGEYCVWSPSLNQVCPDSFGRRHLCPPDHYRGVSSRLYRNIGGGKFVDLARRSGLYNATGKTLGVLVWDFNEDGWPDLMLANDLEPNLLYRNNRNGTFTEMGVEAGVAYSAAGKARAGMGIDSADVDQRGSDSVLVGNGTSESLALFQRDGGRGGESQGYFVDGSPAAGLAAPSLPFLTFGVLFTDYDLDGRTDVITANGHIDPNVGATGGEATFAQRMLLFHNEPAPSHGATFREVGLTAGSALRQPRVHRGLAMGDVDGDGDPDYLVSVCDGQPLLLRNEAISTDDHRPPTADRPTQSPPSPSRGGGQGGGVISTRHWLIVKPIGVRSNRSGIGARFLLRAGGTVQSGWVRSGSSYGSQSDLRAYFGLGNATEVESLEIRWPSGTREVIRNVPVDRHLVVKEGSGRVEPATARGGE